MSEDAHSAHSHGVTSETDTRRLGIALGLILAFMAGEVVAGILANSLALLSDAATCSRMPGRSACRWWSSGSLRVRRRET